MSSCLELSKRLEEAEGYACAQFAVARRKLSPNSDSEWRRIGGGYVVFDGADSPVTQAFGLGVLGELTPAVLDEVEAFFRERDAAVQLEISPFAGVEAFDLLVGRGYRPIEISNVMYRPVVESDAALGAGLSVRLAMDGDEWGALAARGWTYEHPELETFVRAANELVLNKADTFCFIGTVDGVPGAAGSLCLHNGVALFSGAATVPELRRRGLQSALFQERMRFAAAQGCDLAMVVVEVGSDSQRNALRSGFQVSYTRMKWKSS